MQLLATTIVAALLHQPSGRAFIRANPWTLWVSIFGSFGTLIAVHFKRHAYPTNLILLGLFTVAESFMIGTVTSYYSAQIVLQALIITTGMYMQTLVSVHILNVNPTRCLRGLVPLHPPIQGMLSQTIILLDTDFLLSSSMTSPTWGRTSSPDSWACWLPVSFKYSCLSTR